MTPPQAALARAIDFVCPNLAALPSLTANQQDLLARCSEMLGNAMFNQTGFLFPSGAASLGLSNAELADVLGKVSQQNMTSQGTNSIETASKVVGARLAGLRRAGTPRFAFNGWNLEEKTASIAPTFTLRGKGGGASADPNAGNRFGVFLNGNGSFGQKDTTDREVGFDFHTVGGTVGADYRVTDTLILGAAFHYLRTNADLVRLLGDVETDSIGGSLYGTFYLGRFYMDLRGAFKANSYETKRNVVYGTGPNAMGLPSGTVVNRTAKGDTDGQQYEADLGLGYEFSLGGFTLTPFGRVEYLNVAVKSFTETGALGLDLRIRGQRIQSLQSGLGAQLSYALSVPFGVLVPQARAEWRHEFKDTSRGITAQFVNDPFGTSFAIPTDNPDRNFAAVGAGISAMFPGGVSTFVFYETFLGLRDVTNHQFTGGVRLEF